MSTTYSRETVPSTSTSTSTSTGTRTPTTTEDAPRSRRAAVVGWVLTALVVAFLAFDVLGKLTRPAVVVEGTLQLGFTADQIVPIGILLGGALVLFLIPRTTFLGAVVLTAYLGGAVCAELPDAPATGGLRPVAGLRRGGPVGRAVPAQRPAAGAGRRRTLTPDDRAGQPVLDALSRGTWG